MMQTDLAGRVALVTGGTEGIGRGIAVALAQAGVQVVVAGRRVEPGEQAVRAIREQGGEAHFVRADVAREVDVAALVQTVVDRFGRLDCACNNAAVGGPLARLADLAEDDFDQVVGVNFKGVWLCMKHEIRQMLRQGGGAIVNISSVNAHRPTPVGPIYSASKAAVVNLTQSAAVAYAKEGIRVNAIDCGPFRTPGLERVVAASGVATFEEAEARYRQRVPLGRLGRLEEVGAAVVWLCSEGASYVTGHALAVDGGLLASV